MSNYNYNEDYKIFADFLVDDEYAEKLSEIFESDSRRFCRALTDEQEVQIK